MHVEGLTRIDFRTSNIRESIMQRTANTLLLITSAILVGACVTLAPGADQVRLTNKPADVAACKALGNIQCRGTMEGSSMGPPRKISFATKRLA